MAVKDKQHLYTQGNQIYNETAKGANTAGRIGAMHLDTIDTMFALRRPAVYMTYGTLTVDLGGNNVIDEELYLQVVHFNKKTKNWMPVSGAGVNLISPAGSSGGINNEQVAVPNVNLIRCKYPLTQNITGLDFNNVTDKANLFAYLFTPYYNLRYYSFKQFWNNNSGPILTWQNAQTNTNYIKTSYHKYGVKKTGLAVTKAVVNEFGVKSFIVSDILRFKIYANPVRDQLTISFGSMKKFTNPI